MKKKHIGIVVCLLLAVVTALSLSMCIMNHPKEKVHVKLGKPEMPTVNCIVSDKSVNTLFGYREEMDVPFVRDTITPISSGGKLKIEVGHVSGNNLHVKYEVVSLDGETSYKKGDGVLKEGLYELDLQDALSKIKDEREAVLKIILSGEDEEVYFYTRIISDKELNVDKCIEFVQQFNADTFNPKRKEDVASYLEPVWDRANDSFQYVDVNSNIYHVMWGNMEPEVISDVSWSIKETNTVYTSFTAEYQVKASDVDGREEYFNVKEYYRVRFLKDKNYLLNFDRTMEQIFDPTSKFLTEDGLVLGIVPTDIHYKGSNNGNYVAFVQSNNLWMYDIEEKHLSYVFGFADMGDMDSRNKNPRHDIRIVDITDNGNMTFLVSGYMNRGLHEGRTGVSVNYFDYDDYSVEEKAFMPGSMSGELTMDEFGDMIYYSAKSKSVGYVMDNNLYEASAEEKKPKILVEDIPDKEYILSGNGSYFGCRMPGEEEKIFIYSFDERKSYEVPAKEGEAIKPLGFIKDDLIYGRSPSKNNVKISTGEEVLPIESIEIMDKKGDILKRYSSEGMIITGVKVEENLITVYRASNNGDEYVVEKEDYISNNEDDMSKTLRTETFSTELQEKQVYIAFDEEKPEKQVSAGYPEITLCDRIISGGEIKKTGEKEYYMYAKGRPAEKFKDPSDAITKADKMAGVVVDENQKYVWEKGNRSLSYYKEVPSFTIQSGETALEACERALSSFGGTMTRLNGCSLSQACYVINNGTPAITKIGEDTYVLITGYNLDNVEYIYPYDGVTYYEPVTSMEEKIKANGNMFIVNLY